MRRGSFFVKYYIINAFLLCNYTIDFVAKYGKMLLGKFFALNKHFLKGFLSMKRFIGDKQFYRMVFAVALPIIIQNAITNFVNLLDNIMVGSLST